MNDDYKLRTKSLIKWFEYNMAPKQEPAPPVNEEPAKAPVTEEASSAPITDENMAGFGDEEEIDLATTGLSEDDQDLVASIMAKFKEAKQSSVDDVFAKANEAVEAANQPTEEDLVASICAPKQNNVDDLIKQAREQ